MKRKILVSFIIMALAGVSFMSALAEGPGNPPSGSPPDKPSGGTPGGGNSSSDITYVGSTEYSEDGSYAGTSYESTTGGENALLVTGGNVTLTDIDVSKTGDESSESSDFYGTNAGILAADSGSLTITDAEIETGGSHANAVFAYGTGEITISDSVIHTSGNNSGGVMVTGGGTLSSNNNQVTTEGNSSAAIRSDKGGGTLTVNGGTYTTNGQGSPAIYSTADITVNGAELISTSSEGIVVEGKNSVTLEDTVLTDSNTSLNGKSETYKNIFIYQSMSGDANEGTASFTSKGSAITPKNGDVFYVTNTRCVITLENNDFITESDGAFLRAEGAGWGSEGSNGGDVTLLLNDQDIEGDIILDDISSLDMTMEGSTYEGTINGSNASCDISISLSSDSVLILTGDSYITELENADTSNSNIQLNGYTLYVNGKAIDERDEKDEKYDVDEASATADTEASDSSEDVTESGDSQTFSVIRYLPCIIGAAVLIIITVLIIIFGTKH